MKIPKTQKRFCKVCKKYTLHAITLAKKKSRGSLKKGSISRAKKRGLGRGTGNLANYGSKGAMSKWKRYNVKTSKKQDLRLKCQECGKTQPGKGFRTKRLEIK